MLLTNFPMNGAPRGRTQTNNYVKALDLKNEAEQVASSMIARDGDSCDLNKTEGHVVLSYQNFNTGDNIRYADVTGVATYKGSEQDPETESLQADVNPDRGSNRALSIRQDGDKVRYTRQYTSNNVVEHMVHDTATDTFNFFLRDENGHFLPKS